MRRRQCGAWVRSGVALAAALTGLGFAAVAAAAQTTHTVSPGMSRAEVVAQLGSPLAARSSGGSTYLFYHNGCERSCGMHDIVVLDSDRVVDAIFRSPDRHYSGTSSSPAPIPGSAAAHVRSAAPGDPTPAPAPARETMSHRAPRAATSSRSSTTVQAHSEIHIPVGSRATSAKKPPMADTGRRPHAP
jgi:hypothetical protein